MRNDIEGFLHALDDDEIEEMFPDGEDYESAEELKWAFNISHQAAFDALLSRKVQGQILGKATTNPCWPGYKQVGMKKGKNGKMVPNCVPDGGTKSANPVLRDPKGGLTAAGRRHFKRTEGANLKPGVRGAADTPEKMRRKGSFLTRFFTNPSGPMVADNGKPTRLALSAAAWGEAVPTNAQDAAALAAKGRRLLERYQKTKTKKKSASSWSNKALGRGIGVSGTIGSSVGGGAEIDRDSDGVVNDGTPYERPVPRRGDYKKDSNKFMERRRRKFVRDELRRQGMKPTKRAAERSQEERRARAAARSGFDQEADTRRFVRNQLRKQGITPTKKASERSEAERAARRAARAKYNRRMRAGEPKPSTPQRPFPKPGPYPKRPSKPDPDRGTRPADRYPDPERPRDAERERQERMRPPTRDRRPPDRYPDPERPRDAERERQERMRPPRPSRPKPRRPEDNERRTDYI
jgi:hypothetical protein